MKITLLRLWDDIGYMEGGLTIPPIGDELPEASHSYSELHPSSERMFSEIQVRDDWIELHSSSYLEATYQSNNSDSVMTVYGWIDDIQPSSDNQNAPMTRIAWHIDYWRTYNASAEFGQGMVKRKPYISGSEHTYPPQNYAYRYKQQLTRDQLVPSDGQGYLSGVFWVVMSFTESKDGTTYTRLGCFPIERATSSSNSLYLADKTGSTKKSAPTLGSVLDGSWDEAIGLDPQAIKYAGMIHVSPDRVTGSGSSESDPIKVFSSSSGWDLADNGTDKAGFFVYGGSNFTASYSYSLSISASQFQSDDTITACITGFSGEVIGAVPYGMDSETPTMRVALSTNSCYLVIDTEGLHQQSQSEGKSFTIPAVTLETNENAWSSYLYSGQREYDIESRKLGTVDSLIGSATSSALIGAAISGGNPVGAIAGLISGMIGGGIELLGTNGMEQDLTDKLHADQTSKGITAGSGFDALTYGNVPLLVRLEIDEYSKTQRANDLNIYGAHVSEPMESCQSLIDTGGALMIEGLVVTGEIPNTAKKYMTALFKRGVRIE